MTTLIATSVVRGSQQGESHGGVYLIDLDRQRVKQVIDWNTTDIDWQGRGWDRGLRGIEFDGEQIYIAASDELFVYNRKFEKIASYRSPYLKHCHEISRYQRRLYLTSTGFDTVLGFDLDSKQFSLGLKISRTERGFEITPFNPQEAKGPSLSNELHLNNICCLEQGMYISGMKTEGLLKFTGTRIVVTASLPRGTDPAKLEAKEALQLLEDRGKPPKRKRKG